nr:PLP-dependent transferase [Methylobacterium durans]
MSLDRSLQTIAAANGIGTDTNFGAVTPPLYLTTTFTFAGYEQARAYDYTRAGIPAARCSPIRSRNWRVARDLPSQPAAGRRSISSSGPCT